jgi:hypothetical protein
MNLLRELREVEHLLLPWLFILASSSVSLWGFQWFVRLFTTTQAQARVCFFLGWYTHRLPTRLRLSELRFRVDQPATLDHQAPPFTVPWIHTMLGVMLTVICFVASVTLTLARDLWLSVLTLLVFTAAKHCYQGLPFRWPSFQTRLWDHLAKLWISVFSISSAASYNYIMQQGPLDPFKGELTTSRLIAGGVLWPMARHAARWALSKLLLDPHGSRGTVRVYTSMALDLPVLVAVYSQHSLQTVWVLMVCLTLVDSLAVVVLSSFGVSSMLAISNLLWVNLIALNSVLALRQTPRLTSSEFTQRVWYSVMYVVGVLGLSQLWQVAVQRLWTARTPSFVYTRLSGAPRRPHRKRWCVPTLHSEPTDVRLDRDLDFSDLAIPTSRHVPHLLSVVAQSDSVCFSLWGVYLMSR